MTSTEAPDSSNSSFLRSNALALYLVLIAAVPAFALSLLIGMNVVFTTFIMLLFAGATLLIQNRRRSRGSDGSRVDTVAGVVVSGLVAAVAVFVLIQAVPYGRSHSSGAIVAEPKWPDAATRELVVRACFDCHSNQVKYPWYSNVAPISWVVAEHVGDGREAVNFSDLKAGGEGVGNVVESIKEGSMPPGYFTRFGLHKQAKLTKAEIAKLLASLQAMPEFKERRG